MYQPQTMAYCGVIFRLFTGILAWLPMGMSNPCSIHSEGNSTFIVDCRDRGLQNVPNDLTPHDVVELLLDNNHIGPIQFRGFDQLRKLTLNTNQINKVDNSTFYPMHDLEYLSLLENYIHHLDRNSFKYNLKLKFLNIGGNLFTEIPDYLFLNLQLEIIVMQEISYPDVINVTKLPSGFNASTHLKNLTMTSFQMTHITQDFFDNIWNRSTIIHLDLGANQIDYVDSQAFEGFDNLSNFTLNLNINISAMHFNNTLYGLRNSKLKYLSCYYCEGLHYINRTMFSWLNASGLEILWLSSSNITMIEPYSFESLSHLKELHLDDSLMTAYEPYLFAGLEKSLQYIDISQNHFLYDITWSIANLTCVTYVDLSGNPVLGALYADALDGLHLVETLYMYNCDLKHVDNESFHDMHSLNMLDLSQNDKLYELGATAFRGLFNVTELYLDDTVIRGLDEDLFVDMPLLEYLSATSMSVSSLPNRLFRNNTKLIDVAFTSNNINYIHTTFQYMEYLESLTLDSNQIRDFHNFSFINCTALTVLDISQQSDGHSHFIQYVPKSIINHLNKTLIKLFINSNNITVYNDTELNFFKHSSVQSLSAENNPYNCSCMLYTGRFFYNFVLWFNSTKKIPQRTRYLYNCVYSQGHKQDGQPMKLFNFNVGQMI